MSFFTWYLGLIKRPTNVSCPLHLDISITGDPVRFRVWPQRRTEDCQPERSRKLSGGDGNILARKPCLIRSRILVIAACLSE